MITALDIINDPIPLPTTHIPSARTWRKSQVSPMGGRIILELLSCTDRSADASPDPSAAQHRFVRLNINDGITALPDCQSGPGRSCPLAQFAARTRRRGAEVGAFGEVCQLDDGGEGIRFLRQWGA